MESRFRKRKLEIDAHGTRGPKWEHIWMQGNGIDTRTPRCTTIIRAGLITSSHAVATLLQNRNTSEEKKMMSTYKKKKKMQKQMSLAY